VPIIDFGEAIKPKISPQKDKLIDFGEEDEIDRDARTAVTTPQSRLINFEDSESLGITNQKDNQQISLAESALSKVTGIGVAPGLGEQLVTSVKRKGAIAAEALVGDVPYARNLLPEEFATVDPYTRIEKWEAGLLRIGRDIAVFATAEGALAKIPLLAKTALAAKTARSGLAGATLGAVTAGTEDPAEIARRARTVGTITAAVPVVLRGVRKMAEPFLNKIAPKLSPIKAKITDLIRKRYADTQEGLFESEIYIRSIEKNLSKQQREVLSFMREKTGIPKKLGRDDLIKVVRENAKFLKPYANEVGKYLDDAHKFLVDAYGNDVGFWKDYLPHLWNIPTKKMSRVVNYFVTRNPHLKRRYISTIQEGVNKFNLSPKTLDIAEILRIYDQYKVKVVANSKFVDGLKKLKSVTGYDKKGKPILQSLIQRADKAPNDWITIDHPALRRGLAHKGKMAGIGIDKTKDVAHIESIPALIVNKIPVKAHPEIAREIQVILDRPFSNAGARAADTVNAFLKKANLSLSLFHPAALTETAFATPGMAAKTAKLWNPVRVWKAIKSGNYGIFNDIPLSRDAVKHGLKVGPIADVQVGRVRMALRALEERTKRIPLVGTGAKIARSFNDMWDKALWDYYHTSLKLYGYEAHVQRGLKAYPGLAPEVVKREAAQFVNDSFGGQNWDLLLKSAKWRQGMHWLLLSPDWTLSTVRQAIAPTGAGAVSRLGRAFRADMGEEFWRKAIIYFWGGMNILNHSMTKAETGRGKYMWENTPRHKTHLYIGKNPDGTERFMRWGKQFRELPEFFINPVGKAFSKVSPIIRMLTAQVKPHPVFQRDFEGKPFWGKKALAGRAKEIAKSTLPYAIRGSIRGGGPLGMVFPISKGMNPYWARELFKDAIKRKDKRALREVWAGALNNDLDAQALFKQAKTAIKSDITFEFKKDAYQIIDRLRKMGRVKGMAELRHMEESGELGPELKKQIQKILAQKGAVKRQKEQLEELRKKRSKNRIQRGYSS